MSHEIFSKLIKKLFSDINEYTILQFVWVISCYYFVLNSLFKYEIFQNIRINGIEKVFEINNKVLKYMEKYHLLWLIITIMLFTSYLFVAVVCKVIFENYIYLNMVCDYGWYLSSWSFLIYLNYRLFIWTGRYYPLVLLVVTIVVYYIKEACIKRSTKKLI